MRERLRIKIIKSLLFAINFARMPEIATEKAERLRNETGQLKVKVEPSRLRGKPDAGGGNRTI
jgi:hypothetical protein